MKTMIFSSLRLASLRSPMTALGLALGMSLSVLLAACGGGGGGNASTNGGNSASGGAATVGISATPTTTTVGQLITLNWTSTNASSCTASGAWSGAVATSGSQAVTAGAVGAASYTLTCGGVSSTANVTINAAPAAPVVSVVLTPASATPGQSSQLSWSATNATSCTAAGAWTGNQATSGTLAVSQSAVGTYTYTLNCSGTGGSASGSANLAVANPTGSGGNNTATVVVDSGPSGLDNSINEPFVSVTVCRPGTTVCQTIDHVLVDTGSYGLRLLGPLNSALALPAVNTPSGAAAGECVKFADGYYTWGSVQQADVRLDGAGHLAASDRRQQQQLRQRAEHLHQRRRQHGQRVHAGRQRHPRRRPVQAGLRQHLPALQHHRQLLRLRQRQLHRQSDGAGPAGEQPGQLLHHRQQRRAADAAERAGQRRDDADGHADLRRQHPEQQHHRQRDHLSHRQQRQLQHALQERHLWQQLHRQRLERPVLQRQLAAQLLAEQRLLLPGVADQPERREHGRRRQRQRHGQFHHRQRASAGRQRHGRADRRQHRQHADRLLRLGPAVLLRPPRVRRHRKQQHRRRHRAVLGLLTPAHATPRPAQRCPGRFFTPAALTASDKKSLSPPYVIAMSCQLSKVANLIFPHYTG